MLGFDYILTNKTHKLVKMVNFCKSLACIDMQESITSRQRLTLGLARSLNKLTKM